MRTLRLIVREDGTTTLPPDIAPGPVELWLVEPSRPRRQLPPEAAFGALRTDGPSPSDEDVARLLDEARMERFSR